MRKSWASILASLALSLGLNSAWGQAPPSPAPGPLPAPAPLTEEASKAAAAPIAPGAAPMPSVSVPSPAVVIPANGNGNGGGCNDTCGGPHCTWSITGGLYYLRPVWNNNAAFTTSSTVGGTTTTRTSEFDHGFDIGYSAAIGVSMANGAGVRFRWFNFSGSNDSVSAALGAPGTVTIPGVAISGPLAAGTTVGATDNLTLRAYDLEATYTTVGNGWTMIYSGGLRYGQVNTDYTNHLTSAAGVALGSASSTNHFTGWGPTISLEAHHQCGCTCLGVYGSARGSVLFGDRDVSSSASGPSFAPATVLSSTHKDVLPIGELELGIEAGKDLGRLRLFGQLGLVGQAWWGAGNWGPVSSNSGTSNLGLYGGVFRVGLSF